MKRQAITINLKTLEKIKSIIESEIKDIERLIVIKDKNRLGFLFNIINYPTKLSGKKQQYLSDTWQFELKDDKNDKKN